VKKYKVYSSLFQAVNPFTGRLKVYKGVDIVATSFTEAQKAVQVMGLEFLIIDEVVEQGNFVICLN
jgi:hypothetical protein